MPSLREIRNKIKSVRQTQQVTKAMKMISVSRLRRSQAQLLASRPYAQKVHELARDLSGHLAGLEMPELMRPRPAARQRLLILFSSDRGLCGSYNIALFRELLKYFERVKAEGGETVFFVVGKKGRDFLASHGFKIIREFVNFIKRPSYALGQILGKEVMEYYLSHPETAGADVLYMAFHSVGRQTPGFFSILPIGF
ncbi:MAG: F0F1 ATP synthase subunit gamma [Elusimicrobia bacterium]|nr:F0F1 ATP synthase subunit gamma [Elusimicrobiota bacterium]